MAAALAAGNAVVLKPAELAPACGQLIAACFLEAGLPPQIVQVAHGGPDSGLDSVAEYEENALGGPDSDGDSLALKEVDPLSS